MARLAILRWSCPKVSQYDIRRGPPGLTTINHTSPTKILINPYYKSVRLNSTSVPDCNITPNRQFSTIILHEARHAYQDYLSSVDLGADDDDPIFEFDPDNDDDQDWLVDIVPVAPSNILIDSQTPRSVCERPNTIIDNKTYNGENSKDLLDTPDFVRYALEMDAAIFADTHENNNP